MYFLQNGVLHFTDRQLVVDTLQVSQSSSKLPCSIVTWIEIGSTSSILLSPHLIDSFSQDLIKYRTCVHLRLTLSKLVFAVKMTLDVSKGLVIN